MSKLKRTVSGTKSLKIFGAVTEIGTFVLNTGRTDIETVVIFYKLKIGTKSEL